MSLNQQICGTKRRYRKKKTRKKFDAVNALKKIYIFFAIAGE